MKRVYFTETFSFTDANGELVAGTSQDAIDFDTSNGVSAEWQFWGGLTGFIHPRGVIAVKITKIEDI
jgi:hypothetical protein